MAIGRPITETPNIADKIISVISTAGQTEFTVTGGYRVNHLAVFRNGVRLVTGRDYIAGDGLTVELLEDAALNDVLEFQVFDTFSISDAIVGNSTSQTLTGDLTVNGTLTVGASGIGTLVLDTMNVGIISSTTGITTIQSLQASSSTSTGALVVKGGVGIGKSLYVGGNLSVGGTVTYEDVTNVDSVGLVTAGKGLRVTTGGLVVTAGVSTFAGLTTVTNTAAFHSKQLNVSAGSTFGGAVTASDTLTVAGNLDIADTLYHTGDSNTKIRFPSNDTITAATSGSERVRIDSSGNFGIGSNNPQVLLHIASTTPTLRIQDTTNNFYSHISVDDSGSLTLDGDAGNGAGSSRIVFKTDGSEHARVTSEGRLGIGVAAPDGLLHVYAGDSGGSSAVANGVTIENSGTATLQFLSPAANGNQIRFGDNGDNGAGWIQYVHSDNRLDIGTNGSEKLRITSAGKVGIGSAVPGYTLDITGDQMRLRSNSSGSNAVIRLWGEDANTGGAIIAQNSTGSAAPLLFYYSNTAEGMRISSNGNVDINGTPPWSVTGGDWRNLSISGEGSGASGFLWLGNGAAATNADFDLARINVCNGATIVAQIAGATATGANDDGRLAFSTKATTGSLSERMRITADGDVGINETSPDQLLHIKDSNPWIEIEGTAASSGDTGLFINANANHWVIKADNYTSANQFQIKNGDTSSSTARLAIDSSGRLMVGDEVGSNRTSYRTQLSAGDANVLSLQNPSSSDGADIQMSFWARNTNNAAVEYARIIAQAEETQANSTQKGHLRFGINASGTMTEMARLTSNGYLGLGSGSNTNKPLHIYRTTDDAEIRLQTNSGTEQNSYIALRQASGNLEFYTVASGTNMMFHTVNNERMRILDDGGIVINATSRPVVGTEQLGVAGGGASNAVGIAAGCTHNDGIPFFASNSSNTTDMRLMRFAAGSGGDTRGTIIYNGSAMVYGGTSDYRLKENITAISNGITKLKNLNPVNFNWIKDTDDKNIMGFLAHEVQEVMPESVTGTKDAVDSEGNPEYQEMDYGRISPLLTAALQEAIGKIEVLEAKVAALESA